MNKNIILRIILIFGITFFASSNTMAKKRYKKRIKIKNVKKTTSIKEARARSEKEQKKIRRQVDFEVQANMNAWDERSSGVIEIKHTGTPSFDGVDLGRYDLSLEEKGEDHSGLTNLRSQVNEENIEVNFDDELREVSSFKKD